jgi:hypothetical protein
MRDRMVAGFIVWGLVATVACSSGTSSSAPGCKASQASQVTLAVGGYASFDPSADAGCATFPANASSVDSAEYLVVPQSTGGNPGGTAAFTLTDITPSPAGPVPVAANRVASGPGIRVPVAMRFDQFLRGLGRTQPSPSRTAVAPQLAGGAAPAVTPPTVGSLRSFAVCSNLQCTKFTMVGAKAQAVGAHVAIYVDTLAPPNGLDSADIDTLRQTFDARLYALATSTFGAVSDLDGNGVVIALMTPVVNALVTTAQCDTAGYIAGFFFPPDLNLGLPTTESNHGEVFYSVVADPTGTLSCPHSSANVKRVAPSTFVHEFQHMINYAQHILIHTGPAPEQGWLDEGLSKYAEELAARSYLPGDTTTFHNYLDDNNLYDAYLYLNGPGNAFLLIPLDNGTLADVGASWLFVRYLVDHYGTSLPGMLDQTTLTGAANITTHTGAPDFSTLVARWALANWVSDLPGFTPPPELTYTSWSFRAEFDSLHTKFPSHVSATYPLAPPAVGGPQVDLTGKLNAGSGMYVRALQAPSAAGYTLFLSGPNPTTLSAVAPRLTVLRVR